MALIDAGVSLYRGGNEVSAGLAVTYAAFGTAICGLLVLALRRARRRAASPLVEADVENWIVNLAITAGMLVAFCLALFLQRNGMEDAARLVDPVLVGLVVILTLGVPIRMARRGLLALLQRAPALDVVDSIEGLVRSALADLPIRTLYVRVVQPGRTTYVLIHVLLDEHSRRPDHRSAPTSCAGRSSPRWWAGIHQPSSTWSSPPSPSSRYRPPVLPSTPRRLDPQPMRRAG